MPVDEEAITVTGTAQQAAMVRRSAIGETYAHLVHLERRGLLSNASAEADRWRLAGAP